MSTSRHEGLILIAADFGGEDDQFCDTVYLKHGLINGLNHLGDEWSQVRVNVGTPDRALMTGTFTDAAQPLSVGPVQDDVEFWNPWFSIPFPVTVIEPGTPHLFRFWIGVSRDIAGSAIVLRAVLVPSGTPITAETPLAETDSVWESDDVVEGTFAAAYLTGATLGSGAYANALEMPATPDGPTSGTLAVFAQVGNDEGSAMQLEALHLSEVVPV